MLFDLNPNQLIIITPLNVSHLTFKDFYHPGHREPLESCYANHNKEAFIQTLLVGPFFWPTPLGFAVLAAGRRKSNRLIADKKGGGAKRDMCTVPLTGGVTFLPALPFTASPD